MVGVSSIGMSRRMVIRRMVWRRVVRIAMLECLPSIVGLSRAIGELAHALIVLLVIIRRCWRDDRFSGMKTCLILRLGGLGTASNSWLLGGYTRVILLILFLLVELLKGRTLSGWRSLLLFLMLAFGRSFVSGLVFADISYSALIDLNWG